jgi:Leucine-rich repeat (LRR) protein
MGLSGSLPSQFGLLRGLKALDLSCNKLAGTIPGAFGTEGGLWGLRELDLSRNMLTGPLPAGFRGLGELQKLDFSYNTFTVSILQRVAALRECCDQPAGNVTSTVHKGFRLHCTCVSMDSAPA